jgi:hypothetical protein
MIQLIQLRIVLVFGTPDFIWMERSQEAAGSVTSQLGIIHTDHRLGAPASQ